jgi:hypothetical protein
VQHRPREPEAARIVRLHDAREGVDVTELRAANRARIQCGRWSRVRQWVARQGSLDKLAYGLTAVEVAGSLLLILFHVPLDGLATSAPRWGQPNALITLREPAIVRRAYVGHVSSIESALCWTIRRASNPRGDRSSPKRPDFIHHM